MNHSIILGEIEAIHDSWKGGWLWWDGYLTIESNLDLVNPSAKPTFVLTGNIARIGYNLSRQAEKRIVMKFKDTIELAMRLSEYKLLNSDRVIKSVKEAISEAFNDK